VRVYIGAIGDVIAVDRKTGTQVWRSHSSDQTQQNGITAAHLVDGGKVFIGYAGGEISNTRGSIRRVERTSSLVILYDAWRSDQTL
jgi:outer membrane protein assembly factor BamB